MNSLIISHIFLNILLYAYGQRAPPGVNPQHYQQYQAVPQQQYAPPPSPPHHQQQQQQYHPPPSPPQQQFQAAQQQVPTQQVPQQQQQQTNFQHHASHGQPQQILNAQNIAHEKEHIAEHLDVPIDTSKMSEQELQFHYFKMHDADNNNKLDGCELIKSLIHWHEQGSREKQGEIEEKIFKDEELINLIDPILNVDDLNQDGYIDYPEFIRAQQKAANQQQQQQQQPPNKSHN